MEVLMISVSVPLSTAWPAGSAQQARALHDQLRLSDSEWHALKTDRNRRAAEQLSAALIQLLLDGDRQDVIQLVEQAGAWLRGELRDPGCPTHGLRRVSGGGSSAASGSPGSSSARRRSSGE